MGMSEESTPSREHPGEPRGGGPALHEFMAAHRAEVLTACVNRLEAVSPDRSRDELAADLHLVIDEVIRALQEDAGLPVSSPLPGRSPTAAEHGRQRQQLGYEIEKLALDFGTISDSVGALGAERGLVFQSREYQVLDRCIDTAIASALEEYAAREREDQEDATAERIGRLAHELRNTLASAQMAFTVLRSGRVAIDSRTGTVLDRSLRRLAALVDQAIVSVQLQAGLVPARTRIRVAHLVREVEEMVVPERGISMHVDVGDDLEIQADEALLVSALSNLLQNAFKFTRSGGRIVVRGRKEGSAVVIEVEDECGGLPPGDAAELLAPFVQRTPDRRGLGLGLTITHEAVQAQGGELTFCNLPGRGCVFTIRLPAAAH